MRPSALLVGPGILLTFAGLLACGDEPRAAAGGKPAALPISEVVLYSSGVGYFQRDGQIDGRAEVELRFKTDSINDLLKSMVVQDFDGGRVTTVTYGSRDPITKTLKSFGIDLTQDPTLGQLLGQIRGEKIEVATPNPIVGTIVGVEKKQQPAGDNKVVEAEYLNVVTDEGLRSIPISQIGRIKLLNEQLNAELRQALEVLATGHDTQKKTVAITFDGQGQRKVSVSYVMETPVWKTSYRLVLDDEDKPFLQGWAIVENTTDEDWTNARLSLISGRPISFIMDMYQPLYVRRPVVEPELYASLRPQVYGEAMAEREEAKKKDGDRVAKFAAPAPASAAPAGAEMARSKNMLGRGAAGVEALADARQQAARDLKLGEGVASAAESLQAGELFQYAIKTPISLPRQKSAMLPIVSQEVQGTKVSIYNQAVQAKYPLNGFRLKNSTPLHLMQGPITVFDGGTYAGDARIEDLAPDQERLISYAIDLKTEVESLAGAGQQELLTVKIKKGTLITTRKATEEKTYNVKNRDQKKKTVVVEHPFRQDWQLIEPSEPTERTRDVYRFALDVDAGKGARVHVKEERPIQEAVQLTNVASELIAFYLRAPKVSAKVREALQGVVERRDRLNQTTADRTRREQRINEITQEQARIRENMARLAQNSELYNRYVKKFDQQETEIENLRKEIETLKATEARQQKELNDYLLGLDVE
jgi:hypothetical protein